MQKLDSRKSRGNDLTDVTASPLVLSLHETNQPFRVTIGNAKLGMDCTQFFAKHFTPYNPLNRFVDLPHELRFPIWNGFVDL